MTRTCATCNGSKMIGDNPCFRCGGTGTVETQGNCPRCGIGWVNRPYEVCDGCQRTAEINQQIARDRT